MRSTPRASSGIALGALLLLAALSPTFLADFGVHNDWAIGDHVLAADLTLAHAESYHLVRVGRLLNALVYNAQWKQIEDYTDLRHWRFFAAALSVAAFALVAFHASRSTRLAPPRAALLVAALFLAPPLTVHVYYASLFAPGAVAIALVSVIFVAQRRLFAAASAPGARRVWLPGAALATALALVVTHFLYTPSTAFFLVLAAFHLLRGGPAARRTALLELGAYVLSCVLYVVLQRAVVFPWASHAFTYASHWTDSQYNFEVGWLPGERSLGFLRDAASVSLNAWNAFVDFDASWLVLAVVGVALLRSARGCTREERRHGLFVLAFFAACLGLSLAPPLLSDFRWTGYRILVGPALLVCIAFLWALPRVLPARVEPRLPLLSCTLLAGLTLATLATAVREGRAEVACLEDFVLEGPPTDTLLLLGEVSGAGRSRLREEFGYRIREAGPVGEFGFQVVSRLRREGRLDGSALRYVGEVSPDELAALRETPGLAVLDVSASGCVCRAGPVCADVARRE